MARRGDPQPRAVKDRTPAGRTRSRVNGFLVGGGDVLAPALDATRKPRPTRWSTPAFLTVRASGRCRRRSRSARRAAASPRVPRRRRSRSVSTSRDAGGLGHRRPAAGLDHGRALGRLRASAQLAAWSVRVRRPRHSRRRGRQCSCVGPVPRGRGRVCPGPVSVPGFRLVSNQRGWLTRAVCRWVR